MKESVDVTIIGAGVVGLAIAEALAAKNRQVVVLKKTIPLARKQVHGTARLSMQESITRKHS
jgi:flavin-dependent dehydrogenase